MLKCREVAVEAERLLDGELTWPRRLALRFHLLMCHHCQRYVRQLRTLLGAVRTLHPQASETDVAKVTEFVLSSQRRIDDSASRKGPDDT